MQSLRASMSSQPSHPLFRPAEPETRPAPMAALCTVCPEAFNCRRSAQNQRQVQPPSPRVMRRRTWQGASWTWRRHLLPSTAA